MRFGTPSITTTIGAEAMHGNLPWNGFIEDSAKEFAIKAIHLYTNENSWNAAQLSGVKIINRCYSKDRYGSQLLNYIEKNIPI